MAGQSGVAVTSIWLMAGDSVMTNNLGRLGAGILMAIGVVAAGAAQAGQIIWARYGDSDSLDPQRTTTTLSMQSWHQIYDTLLARDAKGRPIPNMAKSYKVSPDGLTVMLKLHKGIKCQDGTDFTSADVKYTIDRAFDKANPSVTQSAWGPITQVTAPDPQTVVIAFSKPFGAFIPFLADPFASMICKSNAAFGKQFGVSKAIGTGPWKLVRWVKGDRIELARNPLYVNYGHIDKNKGAPYEDKLIIRTIPEGQTRLAALRTGSVDVAEPPIEEAAAIRNDPKLKLYVAGNTGQDVFFEFTISRPPFNDERARLAVAHAINPEIALKIVFGNLVQREKCPVAAGVMGNDEAFCDKSIPHYDPAKAKALLAQLGYGPGKPLEVSMLTWTGGGREKLMQVFQNQLAQVGIKAKIEIMDIGTLNARVKQENDTKTGMSTFDLMGWSWYDPDILYQLWHSPGAYHGFNSPELDQMLEATRTTIDPKARLQDVYKVEAYLLSKAIQVPIYTPGWMWLYATRANVTGFRIGPYDQPSFTDVKITR